MCSVTLTRAKRDTPHTNFRFSIERARQKGNEVGLGCESAVLLISLDSLEAALTGVEISHDDAAPHG